MLTATENNNFGNDVVGFLLFSLMQNPADIYLSAEAKTKPKSAKAKNLKDTVSNSIDGHIAGLFGRRAGSNSLDAEIEAAIGNIKSLKQENADFLDKMLDYNRDEKKPVDMAKSALKSLYQIFMSYAKTTHKKIRETVEYGKRKIIEGPVRMTTEKFCKVGQYIMAAISPQWNMPTLSKMDMDTLSVQIANHILIGDEGIRQNPAYGALMYQVKD